MGYTAESVTGGVKTEADTSRIFDVSGDVADDHVPQLDDLLDASITAPEANLVLVSEPAPLPKTPVKAVAFAEPVVAVSPVAGPSGSAPAVRRGLKLPTFDSVFRRPGFQKARRTPAEQKKASERQNKLRAKASSHARKFLTRDPTPRTPTPVLQSVTAIGTPVFTEREAEPPTSFHVPSPAGAAGFDWEAEMEGVELPASSVDETEGDRDVESSSSESEPEPDTDRSKDYTPGRPVLVTKRKASNPILPQEPVQVAKTIQLPQKVELGFQNPNYYGMRKMH